MNRTDMTENFILSCERERHERGMTQSDMASALGMTTDSYKKMVAGTVAKVDLYTAMRLHELTGKSIGELCGDRAIAPMILSSITHLSDRQQRFIASVVDFERAMSESHHDQTNIIPCIIPVGDVEDGMVWDSCSWGHADVGDYTQRYPDITCCVQVTTNNLHPVFVRGDIALVARRAPRNRDVGIFVNKESGRAYVRAYHERDLCYLEPVNGYGETFVVDPDDPEDMGKWIKFGVIVTKLR